MAEHLDDIVLENLDNIEIKNLEGLLIKDFTRPPFFKNFV